MPLHGNQFSATRIDFIAAYVSICFKNTHYAYLLTKYHLGLFMIMHIPPSIGVFLCTKHRYNSRSGYLNPLSNKN